MVQEVVHDWAHHVRENVLSHKVYRVFNDHDSEVDELMHDEGRDRIVMIEVWLTEVNVCAVDDWVEVTVLIQDKVSLEINLEVLENQLDVAVVGQEPEVNILLGIDLPVFNSWEFHIDKGFVEGSG